MTDALIVSAVRTPIATSYRGTLRDTPPEDLAALVVAEAVRRSGLEAGDFDDVIMAEALAGGGDIARHAAVAAGMVGVPGQAINRHCAGSLTAVANAAANVMSGMERAIVAGGTHSYSMNPTLTYRVPGTDAPRTGLGPTFPTYTDATYGPADDDTTLSVGWNVAQECGLTREDMDQWAFRSHQRAVAALDTGHFDDEIVPVPVVLEGEPGLFEADEHPRRSSSLEKLASLNPLHPEIDGFSITAGNASGVNDAAAALAVVGREFARDRGLRPLARIVAWAAVGVPPHLTGLGAIEAAELVLKRAGLSAGDIDVWEINEAFASVPVAAVKHFGLDEDRVNPWGSGCSLGHPIAASGARMLTTLAHELRRRGSGRAVATMCAAGGQGGAVLIEAV